MRFAQTILLGILAVTVAASPISPRGHPDWDGYKDCCDKRDRYGQYNDCQRPNRWDDDWRDKNDYDDNKWGHDGHKYWKQCRNDWQGQYDTWKKAKDKYYNDHKDKYDREGPWWEQEEKQWNKEHDQWEDGDHWKPKPKPEWNPDHDGWHHYKEKIVLKCVGEIEYRDYGGYGQPAPKSEWNPGKYGWCHYNEEIYLRCKVKVVYKYYDSD